MDLKANSPLTSDTYRSDFGNERAKINFAFHLYPKANDI